MLGSLRSVMLTLVALAATGCGGADSAKRLQETEPAACVAGEQAACECSGVQGQATCSESGTLGDCQCNAGQGAGGQGPGGVGAGGSGPGVGGSSSSGQGGGGATEAGVTQLAKGTTPLIDVFVVPAGVVVVTETELILVGATGNEIAKKAWPRPITCADFDGERLLVTDKARFTAFSADLNEGASGDLLETCQSVVLVRNARFVCSPVDGTDGIFSTYDTSTGQLVTTSEKQPYQGRRMRSVPGFDEFVTVTEHSSPSDFFLFSISANGQATYVNESPYHGDFEATRVYAFNGNPATHLVTNEGILLKLHGEHCTKETGSFDSECFVKDGALGTLAGTQRFVGMETGSNGKLYAMVSVAGGASFKNSLCKAGCLLQRIDVGSRIVESQHSYPLAMGEVIATRFDAATGTVVMGFRLPGDYNSPGDMYPGYRVTRLVLE